MYRAPLIMIFGISGVGKTTACEAFAKAHPDYRYDRASAILQKAHGLPIEALRTAASASVVSNQAILPPIVMALRKEDPLRTFLLDSHAVIDNDAAIVEVPLNTIAALEPDGFILLEADAATVKQRRAQGLRARPARSIAQIIGEAEAERRVVVSYAAALDKPLVSDLVTEEYDLQSAIDRLNAEVQSQHS